MRNGPNFDVARVPRLRALTLLRLRAQKTLLLSFLCQKKCFNVRLTLSACPSSFWQYPIYKYVLNSIADVLQVCVELELPVDPPARNAAE
jgi:hypothetical protein